MLTAIKCMSKVPDIQMSRAMRKSIWFANRSGTNQAVQAQKMTLEILVLESRGIVLSVWQKTKALISFTVTAKQICNFHIWRLLVFLCSGSNVIYTSNEIMHNI